MQSDNPIPSALTASSSLRYGITSTDLVVLFLRFGILIVFMPVFGDMASLGGGRGGEGGEDGKGQNDPASSRISTSLPPPKSSANLDFADEFPTSAQKQQDSASLKDRTSDRYPFSSQNDHVNISTAQNNSSFLFANANNFSSSAMDSGLYGALDIGNNTDIDIVELWNSSILLDSNSTLDNNTSLLTAPSLSTLLEVGTQTYIIVLLSVVVLFTIMFTMFGLFMKAEAHTKADSHGFSHGLLGSENKYTFGLTSTYMGGLSSNSNLTHQSFLDS